MSRYSSSYKAREPGRIGNVRKDGFAAASSKHESVTTKRKSENFVCIAGQREGDTKESRQTAVEPKKPRFTYGGGGNVSMSFEELMNQAKQNSNVDAVAQKHVAILRQEQPIARQPQMSSRSYPPISSNASRVPSRVPSNEVSTHRAPSPKPKATKKEPSALALAAMKREVPRRSDLPKNSRAPMDKSRSAVPFREPRMPPPMPRSNGAAYGSTRPQQSERPREPSRPNLPPASSSKYSSSSQSKTSASSSSKYGSSSTSSSSKNGSSTYPNDSSSKYGSSRSQLPPKPSSKDNPYALQDRLILGDAKTKKVVERPKPLPPTPNAQSNPAVMRKPTTILPGDLRYQGPPPAAKKPKPAEQKPKLGAWAKIGGESSRSSRDNNERIPHEVFGNMIKVRAPKAPEPKRPPPIPVPQRQPQNQSLVHSMSRSVPNEMAERRRLAAAARMRASGRPSAELRRRSEQYPGSSSARHRPMPYGGQNSRQSYGSYLSGHDDLTGDEYDDDNYDNDDEYDSDMADFIDDTEVDEMAREDFEESLRLINPHYNKAKWKLREAMIDERRMDARYRDIEAEDRRATRLALVEDLMEARKGSKGLG